MPLSKLKDSFNDGTSIAYIEELEQRYKADPSSVDKTWGMFFKAMGEQYSSTAQQYGLQYSHFIMHRAFTLSCTVQSNAVSTHDHA